MNWYRQLYIGKSLADSAADLCSMIEEKTAECRYYMLILSVNGKDMLDIRPVRDLLRPEIAAAHPLIVGIAGTYEEALAIVPQIGTDCVRQRHDGNIRAMFTEAV